MSNDPDPTPEAPGGTPAPNHVLGPRKRIIAREVQSAALTTLNPTDLARMGNSLEIAPPRLKVRPEPLVLDPTAAIGERHRKHSHQRGYRLTVIATTISFLAACGAIALLLMDRLNPAKLIAFGSVAAAVAAILLSRTSPLAARLRGYAIAATLLSIVALAANLAGNMVHELITESKTTVSKPGPR